MSMWEMITHDVLGNAKHGYEVNDNYSHGEIELSDNPSDKEIKSAFGIRCQIETYGDDVYIQVIRKRDGYPIGELRKIIE